MNLAKVNRPSLYMPELILAYVSRMCLPLEVNFEAIYQTLALNLSLLFCVQSLRSNEKTVRHGLIRHKLDKFFRKLLEIEVVCAHVLIH